MKDNNAFFVCLSSTFELYSLDDVCEILRIYENLIEIMINFFYLGYIIIKLTIYIYYIIFKYEKRETSKFEKKKRKT
jgi:hypothetical protein